MKVFEKFKLRILYFLGQTYVKTPPGGAGEKSDKLFSMILKAKISKDKNFYKRFRYVNKFYCRKYSQRDRNYLA